jgi:translation initiation factor 1
MKTQSPKRNDSNGLVYSTNPDLILNSSASTGEEEPTLLPEKQNLLITLDKKQRSGKAVTLVSGFKGLEKDREELGRLLKAKCGVGGSVKDGQILIQGDLREKVLGILIGMGFRAKRGN